MKLMWLVLGLVVLGARAAELPKNEFTTNIFPTWASVPGGISTHRYTNSEPVAFAPLGTNEWIYRPTVFADRVFVVPVQMIWWTNELNKPELLEWPLTRPRLVSETLRTNTVTQ